MKILIVDDTHSYAVALAAMLNEERFKVYIVDNGRQALEVIAKGGIDFVLSDLNMPVMDGFQLALNLRDSKIPILVYTTMNVPEDLLDLCIKMKIEKLLGNSTLMKIKNAVLERVDRASIENRRLGAIT